MKLIVEAIPTPKGFVHPPAKHDALPRHEFSMGLIGKFHSFMPIHFGKRQLTF
jgi:hypothetical protein